MASVTSVRRRTAMRRFDGPVLRRSVDDRARTLRIGTSPADGLLVGPLADVGLAVLVS